MSPELNYKGYKIVFSEWRDTWECDVSGEGQSVAAIKAVIDKHIKKESAFQRQTALQEAGRRWKDNGKSAIATIEVTSVSADDPGYFWIVNEDGSRRKECGKGLFLDCEENMARARQIDGIDEEIKNLRERREALLTNMIRFTPSK